MWLFVRPIFSWGEKKRDFAKILRRGEIILGFVGDKEGEKMGEMPSFFLKIIEM